MHDHCEKLLKEHRANAFSDNVRKWAMPLLPGVKKTKTLCKCKPPEFGWLVNTLQMAR